jgi:hypothetical protein
MLRKLVDLVGIYLSHRVTTLRRQAKQPPKLLMLPIAANGRHAYLSRDLVVLRTLEGLEMTMSNESRRLAGILLIVLPTVMYGGVSILSLLIGDPKYMENPLRQDLWRAGHNTCRRLAHPGACGAALRG